MTDRKQALTDLLELVTDGVDFSEVGYSDFSNAFPAVQSGEYGPWDNDRSDCAIKAYNGSLDAALALHNAVLGGWCVKTINQMCLRWYVCIYQDMGDEWPKWTPFPEMDAAHTTPARAWLIAIIKALISQEDAQ